MPVLTNATIEEIRAAAVRLCRDYLSGHWKSITIEDVIVKRISGGLSNFLYHVSLPEICDKNSNNILCNTQNTTNVSKRQRTDSGTNIVEPNEVLIRIYGQTHGEHALESMITESVVFALLSERNLGPKLHGLFPGGRIEQYIPARPLTTVELSDRRTSTKIAEKMAEIHSLNIPMSKEPHWLWNTMQRWLKTVESTLKDERFPNEKKSEFEELKKVDFRKEVEWVRNLVAKGNHPVVFCHNDLQEGNILLRKEDPETRSDSSISGYLTHTEDEPSTSADSDRNANATACLSDGSLKKCLIPPGTDSTRDYGYSKQLEDCEPNLIIIDFEYCAYNYRGFDLANHFIEWTIDYSNPQFPFYFHNKEQYPTREQRTDFISAYLKKQNDCVENYSPPSEEIEVIENEVKVFSLVSHLLWSLWSVVNVQQNIEFGYWEYGVSRIREYLKQKDCLNVNSPT